MKPKVELLAPAGSMESMIAAINAGADAVYMGGSRFGARAYADNPQEDGFLQAIDYAHLHGCRLYMTVNTLVKEREMGELPGFLEPCYRQGLDAVIVQDLGVLALIRECFPGLSLHISTQTTVTGFRMAKMFKELGASRIVTARELSLGEIAKIRDKVDIEIESFVHGALCYCYSGQCLLSSLIGGRSGNRGRCAQPCRLPYRIEKDGETDSSVGKKARQRSGKAEQYIMNLKDLCTLDILPDILEAGVYSLKIEGRMKGPRYTAGVVSIYRKYLDLYQKNGREGYRVDPADKELLLKLYDRGGFTEGYYRQHNGRDMIYPGEKPAFRETDQGLLDCLDQKYVNQRKQEPVEGRLKVQEGRCMSLTLRLAGEEEPGALEEKSAGRTEPEVEVKGGLVQTARSQPATREQLDRQIRKTGGTPFYFRCLEVELEGNCFVPVQELNQLRRRGLEALEQKIQEGYRRNLAAAREEKKREQGQDKKPPVMRIHVSLEEPEGLETAVMHPEVEEIYLDACGFSAEVWQTSVKRCHGRGKQCALLLPHIFREKAEQYFMAHMRELKEAGFDELILRSLEELLFLREQGLKLPLVLDGNLYGTNRRACAVMKAAGAARLTLPLELNLRELTELGQEGQELVGYGYLPAMVSAQCVRKTSGKCTGQPGVIFMKDRRGKRLPVKNHCRFCYNTIYNPDPLSLLGLKEQVRELGPGVLRLSFTIEDPPQIQKVLDAYGKHFRRGEDWEMPFKEFTRGHFKRGVE